MLRRILFLGFIFTILMSVAVYAGTYGTVTGSRVNVRSCAEICDSNRLFQVERGSVVELHGVDGDFFQATVSGESGVYISRDFVRVTQIQGTLTDEMWIYGLPGEDRIARLSPGATVEVTSVYENWYGISFSGGTAFIEKSAVHLPFFVELPTARIGGTLADEIIATAKNYLGSPYRWGGTTPSGFDCSGFMVFLFTRHGISLNRSSRDQARNGVYVSQSELERGDLVFFGNGNHINHVGMYIGGGQFIHSSSHRSGGVIISNMNTHYNVRGFITARRVI